MKAFTVGVLVVAGSIFDRSSTQNVLSYRYRYCLLYINVSHATG
jgi:hypothetical protein